MTATDLAYVRYQVTDLDRAAGFMTDFGLSVAERTSTHLYLRGASSVSYIYVAELGSDNRFLGAGFHVDAPAALARLASLPGSTAIEPVSGPGGGLRVRMTMPDGVEIDAVHGASPAAALPVRAANRFNNGEAKPRVNACVRQRTEAVPVLRLGHFVLHVRDHEASVAWIGERLGLLPSDWLATPAAPDRPIGTFMRLDCGAKLVDHHCLFIIQADRPGVHHCSFEVQDLDHLMAAHDYLFAKGYRLDCGVGRHMLGSQVFDYWRDAFGFRVEHYTDGDIVNHEHRPGTFTGTADQTTQWGARPPLEFFDLADHDATRPFHPSLSGIPS